ncbi:hypothetical protein F8M41_011605 [Gigaspora margarita]|uniref:Uncharacterized protein n=1 Tax=Gigaspora margarita TaxID=4874 RepID=A0A8H4A048_GIGMA|nr:hypothetical protein F8M41_011605 [Gigaspora margarita]
MSYLQELKNIDKIRFSWNELKTLKDTDLFCNKFKEQTNWKVEAECTIGNIKDKVEKNGGTPAHQCLFGIVRRDEFQEIYKLVIAEDVNIVHYRWVEQESDREQIVRDITECLMQKVEVTRNEYQSVASKNRKAKVKDGARGNRPDFMIQALLDQKWNEIVYAESGDIKKACERCSTKELYCFWNQYYRRKYNSLWINSRKWVKYYLLIAEAKILLRSESVKEVEEFVHVLITIWNGLIANLQYLINTIQKKTRKVSERSLSCERLNKKKSEEFGKE